MIRIIITIASRISALHSKVKYSVGIDAEPDNDMGGESAIRKIAAVTTIIDRVVGRLLHVIDPGTEFATSDLKDTAETGTTEVRAKIPMGDGYEISLELDVTTIGYTPTRAALHELVATGIDDEIGAIVDAWHPNLATSDRMALFDQIKTSVGDQLGIEDKTLVGAGTPA